MATHSYAISPGGMNKTPGRLGVTVNAIALIATGAFLIYPGLMVGAFPLVQVERE
jgi:hypothetical protein